MLWRTGSPNPCARLTNCFMCFKAIPNRIRKSESNGIASKFAQTGWLESKSNMNRLARIEIEIKSGQIEIASKYKESAPKHKIWSRSARSESKSKSNQNVGIGTDIETTSANRNQISICESNREIKPAKSKS